MYPWIRFAREMLRARKMPALNVGETHATPLRCGIFDIDYQFEMNNGRIITLFDLGRVPMFVRMGVLEEMQAAGWYGTIAGSSIRYRRRITIGQKLEIRSRAVGVDNRFFYIEQGIFRGDECCAHGLLRAAITTGKGIVPTGDVLERLGFVDTIPILPDWARDWDRAEASRPWPPMQDRPHPAPALLRA